MCISWLHRTAVCTQSSPVSTETTLQAHDRAAGEGYDETTNEGACVYSLATCSISVPESSLRVTFTTQPERVTLHL